MTHISVNYRANCRICGNSNVWKWASLHNMPLTDDLKLLNQGKEVFLHDIDVFRCNSCGVSQIMHELDMSEYYKNYAYTVASSPTANTFMRKLASSIFNKYSLKSGCKVIEVGSGDGAQLLCFAELGAKVFGYEPAYELCQISNSIGVPAFQGLFEEDSIKHIPIEYLPANILLLTYTFDHIPEPMSFLDAAMQILDPNEGLLIIEVHDLAMIVNRKEYCLFEHEHFTYLSDYSMQKVLDKAGFKLLTTDLLPETERRGNSLLIVATPHGSIYSKDELQDNISPEITIDQLKDFNEQMHRSISALDQFVEMNVASGKRVAGFGAGGRGVMTVAALKSFDRIEYICDNNPKFHGMFTPKTNIPIYSVEQLENDPVDVLIVFSFGYIEEIRQQISSLKHYPKEIVSILEVL